LGLAPGVGLVQLAALPIEHALELCEITSQRIESGGELGRRGRKLPDLDVRLLELEEKNELFAHFVTFRRQASHRPTRSGLGIIHLVSGPTWARTRDQPVMSRPL